MLEKEPTKKLNQQRESETDINFNLNSNEVTDNVESQILDMPIAW